MPTARVKVQDPTTMATVSGYSPVAEDRGRELQFSVSEVPRDAGSAPVGQGDYRLQAESVFNDLAFALQSAGAGLGDPT